MGKTIGVWFRKCLRLTDNLPLLDACSKADNVVCFFVLDPWFETSKVGVNRFRFLLESLTDLDAQLQKKHKSRLLILKGKPEEVISKLVGGGGGSGPSSPSKGNSPSKLTPNVNKINFKLDKLVFEFDSEPYALIRDQKAQDICKKQNVGCEVFQNGHTLMDLSEVMKAFKTDKKQKPPTDMNGITKMVKKFTKTPESAKKINIPMWKPAPTKIPPLPSSVTAGNFGVPQLSDVGYSKEEIEFSNKGMSRKQFPGGEQEALKRLQARVSSQTSYVCQFEKPRTSSTNQKSASQMKLSEKESNWTEPSTTGLSPYLKFGCISVKHLWHETQKCYDKAPGGKHAIPPMSLHGQLLFREMFYVLGYVVPNWDKPDNNAMCKPIAWQTPKNDKFLTAWKEGKTGYPYIDALMRQLKETGWMHHLGRHAVSCFLTRGDLYQHWTYGRDHFDKLLLDADWSLNNGNWLWLAGVAPFSMPFFRVYSPTPDDKSSLNVEQTGEFVKRFVPELKNVPSKFIYKPWLMNAEVQKQANCVLGKDYPYPIVDHGKASKANLNAFKISSDEIKVGKKAASPKRIAGTPGVAEFEIPAGKGAGGGSSGTGAGNKRQMKVTEFFSGGPAAKKRKSG
ncbi:unnamed protein product [Amoebophrya sp. A120]|nr:unnamed protein product [Amoebophrya sp. A120]|eukprot:GSA120T00008578001.1